MINSGPLMRRPMRQTRLLRWIIRWAIGAILLPIIAIPIMAAAQGRQLQLVSTVWSPFTNAPGQPRFALVAGYAYGEAVETKEGPIFVGSNSEEDSLANSSTVRRITR